MRNGGFAILLGLVAGLANAQTIYKCTGADGRITYSNLACATEDSSPTKSGASKSTQTTPGAAPAAAAPARGALPKQCDNAAQLTSVVAKLDSPKTPDDVRGFLADERFRLMRCEYTRFTPEERRERDAAVAGVDSSDPGRRKAAMARVESLYDRHLTAADRSARGVAARP